ncbi:PP2C family protein-serine/threonine phosphatase [Leptothoe sp. PORK10 BA2]|uniref:PP2C family protein-serine/threonine phosphatase n=1 Tax=Leptothoe sp. PORK10 BA2 TaxID=3110254 RepID=UPI002B20B722|nr:protein phosphatase 2C domain-containing protein [Leptothoe sp. PORK10 BA2]MEA5463562.1 protein phosphatase 2C domain-containing protein [Leptothoe sp. PORK10 BA2]
MIKCPNPECQASNPEGTEKCVSCQAFVPHRYLWAVGQGALGPDNLDGRYIWKHQRIVLDTEPGTPPRSPEPVPPHVWPYLMLAPFSLNVPQPYALLSSGTGGSAGTGSGESGDADILLLDVAAIATAPGDDKPSLLPALTEVWSTASPLRQLNWLWQIAGLWPDFLEQQVASSLLLGSHMRVHGSLVRFLELSQDSQPFTLRNLGASWQTLIPQAQPSIRDFLDSLCNYLVEGDITVPAVLVTCLDQAIAAAAAGYRVEYGLSVMTDRGPSRKRNEDACFPSGGSTQTHILGPKANSQHRPPLLLLVCDGIGGHDGGDVASQLAIATIQQELAPLMEWLEDQPIHDPETVTLAMEQAICAANDNISEHNDRAQRQSRDRMGTTVVMALIFGVHIYIGHVGDSRAYRISTNSCRQITFDDDVAAREVRLGYGFYADVSNRSGTGALIQALGMANSTALHVVVQRLILDEDIVLLLCSDGLSDYDRIEQFWPTHVLPILIGQLTPTAAVNNLVHLANTYNGHDNITVGIVAGQIQPLKPVTVPLPLPAQPEVAQLPRPNFPRPKPPAPTSTQLPVKPTMRPAEKKGPSPWLWLLGLTGILGAATALTMVFFREEPRNTTINAVPSLPETIQDKINPETDSVGIAPDELARPTLTPGSYLQLRQSVDLLTTPQPNEDDGNALGQLPDGAIVQVLTRQDAAADQSRWVKLKVCAVNLDDRPSRPSDPAATVTPSGLTSLTSGAEGWVLEAKLASIVGTAPVLNCPSE